MLKKFKTLKREWVDSKRRVSPADNALKTVVMCKNCYAFYYKNSWNFKRPSYLSENQEEETSVRFTQCGACLEQENALFEQEASLILGSEQMG